MAAEPAARTLIVGMGAVGYSLGHRKVIPPVSEGLGGTESGDCRGTS